MKEVLTGVTVTISEGGLLPQHRIRTDCTIRTNGRRSKACSGLSSWIKILFEGRLWQHLRVMTVDVPTIVEMRQQHRRRGDCWPGPVRSEDPKDTTTRQPLLLASCWLLKPATSSLYRASSTTAIVVAAGRSCAAPTTHPE